MYRYSVTFLQKCVKVGYWSKFDEIFQKNFSFLKYGVAVIE